MKRILQYGKRGLVITAIAYGLVVLFGLVAGRIVQFRDSDEEIRAHYAARHLPIHISTYRTQGRDMRFIYTDRDPAKPLYLLIHGAPSSSNYYHHFMDDTALRRMANMAAVDRAGYGYSGFGKPLPSLKMQAATIKPVLDSLRHAGQPVVVVGASYGTSVACRLAMDYPQLVDGLVLIAPALAPGEEKTYAISYALESPLLTWAQPPMIHSANVEKLTHEAELRKMEPRWGEIRVPVFYFQGMEDDLIYTTNAAFARRKLVQARHLSITMIPHRGHLLVYDEAPRLKQALADMLPRAGQYLAQRTGAASMPGALARVETPNALSRPKNQ
jgi:pimeloyl-ACP methyl ester carboxylesterase